VKVEEFSNLLRIFVTVYIYYLFELNHTKLSIVDCYVSEIIKSNPDYIGFSLEDIFGPFSRLIRKRIKELTEIPIIVGGSLTPFLDLKELDKIFAREYFDYLIIGAGEYALPFLMEKIGNKEEPKGIANVFYKEGGKVKGNILEVIDDLDSLPYPDYSQFDLDLYLTPKRLLPLQTARGCSWKKCSFCSHHNIYQGKYRAFSIEKVIETIKHLRNSYNCSHFIFHDEELPSVKAKEISKAILNDNLRGVSIYTYARLTNGYNNNELLGYLSKAGFSTFAWGMESGCQRVLDLMNKGTRLSEMGQVLKKSSRKGITNLCFIFFGFPGETRKEAQQTIEFLKDHAEYIEDIMLSTFRLDQFSPLAKNPEKWGVVIKKDGSYAHKSGVTFEEINSFLPKLDEEVMINSIKISSNKLKYILPGLNRRMMHFLNSSYGLLSRAVLLERLKKGKINSIFPIILGEIRKRGSRIMLQPININETSFISQFHSEKEAVLNKLEEKLYILSDGRLSIKDITLSVCKDFEKDYTEKYIHKRCLDFFFDIFAKGFGIGFAKSWRAS
jgi:radical SAM superfamily enzyme YgiQ (UPF0313 family)